MVTEEMLIECRRRYPIGTTFICPETNRRYIIEKQDTNTYELFTNYGINGGHGKGYLYNHGKWAKIVSLPKGYNVEPVCEIW
jgi:hypothetical protein